MLETPDWMREKLGDYRALSAIIALTEQSLAEDDRITKLVSLIELAAGDIKKLRKDRESTILEAKEEQKMIKMEFQDHWDVDGKTYSCDMGKVSLRTKKTLEIADQTSLLIWLFKLERLEAAIRSLDTDYLKKLKDADLLPDAMAVYKSKTTVAITEAPQ